MVHGFPTTFVSGAITMGYFLSGVFFLKFWRRTGDTLFMIFAAAFWLLCANQLAFTWSASAEQEGGWPFLLRLAAFSLLIAGIVYKNLQGARRR